VALATILGLFKHFEFQRRPIAGFGGGDLQRTALTIPVIFSYSDFARKHLHFQTRDLIALATIY
jgi:hypothetical protein